MLKRDPALVDSTSPRRGEKASYYSAVCLETGEVEWMESAAFLERLRHWKAISTPKRALAILASAC